MMAKLKYVMPIVAVALWFGWYVWSDYSWANRFVPKMEREGWHVAAVSANVVYLERPWTLFKTPIDTIWFIRPGNEIEEGLVLNEVYQVFNPNSDEKAETFHQLVDCKRFRAAIVPKVEQLDDPKYKPQWEDAEQGPDIQGIQLFIASCRNFYPKEAYEADRKCVNDTTLMRPKNTTTCVPKEFGLIPPEETAVSGKNIRILVMTREKWSKLSRDEQGLYVKGFLEAVSFTMYGEWPQNAEFVRPFSDWTACAEHERPDRWIPMYDWFLYGYLDRTAASQCWKIAPLVCSKYLGKGDKTWNPVRLVSEKEWVALSPRDRSYYVTAYIETSYELMRRQKSADNIERLQACLATKGLEGIMTAVEQTPIDWRYPLPWSISQALGKACG
jgi:hypothetical protein